MAPVQGDSMRAWRLGAQLAILTLVLISQTAFASEWHTIVLPARPLNIIAVGDALWVCGADEMVAESTDGGKTWSVQHLAKGGAVFLAIGDAGGHALYAAGTGDALFFTRNAGKIWTRASVPETVVYAASFSDDQNGLIQTAHTIYRTSDGGKSWTGVPIDLTNGPLKGFPYVRTLATLDANHMIVVVSQGNANYYADKLLVTADGGRSWRPLDIPSTGLTSLSTQEGEYWAAGGEVIEKDKPGGGYSVPVVLRSKDGETWTHLTKWAPKQFSACNSQTCLFGDGAGVDFRATSPRSYWTFPREKAATSKWAVANGGICSVGTDLKCAAITPTEAIPADVGDSPIPAALSPPPLNAPLRRGLQCIACDVDRIIVSQNFQGLAEVEFKIHIAQNGLVDDLQVIQATKPEIGDRLASQVRNWVFLPYQKDGVVHPVVTNVKLRVQVIKNN